MPGWLIIGSDDHDGAMCPAQAGTRHRPHGLGRLPGLAGGPGAPQDEELGMRRPVYKRPGGQLVG